MDMLVDGEVDPMAHPLPQTHFILAFGWYCGWVSDFIIT